MDAPSANNIRDHANSKKRIGPDLTRSSYMETSAAIEALIKDLAPLPTRYDVQSDQHEYFNGFSYFDCFGGVMIQTMSAEITARVIEDAVDNAPPDYNAVTTCLALIGDKYSLSNITCPNAKSVVFLPGNNLFKTINRERLDNLLHRDPNVMLKPHPMTTEVGMQWLGLNYGFDRIIPPKESGHTYLTQCEMSWTGVNSEMGLISAMKKRKFDHITKVHSIPTMAYAPLYRLFERDQTNTDHNYEIMARAFGAKDSGIIMPWMNDKEERINSFFRSAMKIRKFFKPSYAGLQFPVKDHNQAHTVAKK